MLACGGAELAASLKGREFYQLVFSPADQANAWITYSRVESGADLI
ncbi:MAG: hypothetical protein ACLPXT_00270 [Terracidiphilus sp.]